MTPDCLQASQILPSLTEEETLCVRCWLPLVRECNAHTHTHTHTHTHMLAVSRDGTARLWDCGSARCLAKIVSITHPIHSCSVTASEAVAKRNPAQPLGTGNATCRWPFSRAPSPPEPECGTSDKLVVLACGDRYLRGVDIRSRHQVTFHI